MHAILPGRGGGCMGTTIHLGGLLQSFIAHQNSTGAQPFDICQGPLCCMLNVAMQGANKLASISIIYSRACFIFPLPVLCVTLTP
jgi:hypothetical protein